MNYFSHYNQFSPAVLIFPGSLSPSLAPIYFSHPTHYALNPRHHLFQAAYIPNSNAMTQTSARRTGKIHTHETTAKKTHHQQSQQSQSNIIIMNITEANFLLIKLSVVALHIHINDDASTKTHISAYKLVEFRAMQLPSRRAATSIRFHNFPRFFVRDHPERNSRGIGDARESRRRKHFISASTGSCTA